MTDASGKIRSVQVESVDFQIIPPFFMELGMVSAFQTLPGGSACWGSDVPVKVTSAVWLLLQHEILGEWNGFNESLVPLISANFLLCGN